VLLPQATALHEITRNHRHPPSAPLPKSSKNLDDDWTGANDHNFNYKKIRMVHIGRKNGIL
jgi:hypothetical protein